MSYHSSDSEASSAGSGSGSGSDGDGDGGDGGGRAGTSPTAVATRPGTATDAGDGAGDATAAAVIAAAADPPDPAAERAAKIARLFARRYLGSRQALVVPDPGSLCMLFRMPPPNAPPGCYPTVLGPSRFPPNTFSDRARCISPATDGPGPHSR